MAPENPPEGEVLASGRAATVAQLLAVGQTRRATEMAAAAIAAAPGDPDAHLSMCQAQLAQNNLDAARAAAEEALRLAPDADSPFYLLAVVAQRQGKFAESERALLTAIEIDPAWARYHVAYARLLSLCDRDTAALAVVENALELDPEDSDAHELRARLLLIVSPRHWSMSEEVARRALTLDPENADAHATLGTVLLRSGRRAEAEECFREALALDPADRLARRGLAELVMARTILYRPFLSYSLWMQRMGIGGQLTVLFGLWALVSAALGVMRGRPDLELASETLRLVYMIFAAYTWFAEPLTRWVLRRHYPWLAD